MSERPVNEFSRGWLVLLGCFIGIGLSIVSLIYYSSGIWVQPWQEEFGWSRAEIGIGSGLSTLAIVVGAPFAGSLIDKYGLKIMATMSLLLYGSCLYAFSRLDGSLWLFYLLFIVMSFLALPSTGIGFTRVVNAWFDKNKGLALGICLTSAGLGAFFTNKFLTPFVAEHGWREGFFVLFCIVMIGIPFVWFLVKDVPPVTGEKDEEIILSGLTLKEAIKTREFKILAVFFLMTAIAILGLIPNFIPLLQDAGMTAADAGSYAAILGLSVMVGRLLTGFLIDRIFAPYVIAVLLIFVSSGCFAMGFGGVDYVLWAAIAIGLAVGSEVDLIGYFTAKYFGLKHYGNLSGVIYSIFNTGAIISPALVGYIWDSTGNYDIALLGAGFILLVAAAISLLLPKFDNKNKTKMA